MRVMKNKGIKALIEKVLEEEVLEEIGGRLEAVTMEEAIIRAAARRAMDMKNRLGMEATRFLTEYQYGKPVQPTVIGVSRFDSSYDEFSDEELREIEDKLLKGAMGGHTELTQKDPGRFIEEGRRDQIIQGVVKARGEDIFERNERAREANKEKRKEGNPEILQNPEGTDELCDYARKLVEEPWF